MKLATHKLAPHRVAIVGPIIAFHLVLVGVLAMHVGWTPDEFGYFLSGGNLVYGGIWEVPEQRFQGPLGLLANQLFAFAAPAELIAHEALPKTVRLGMLVFPLALLAAIGLWARALFGDRAAVIAVLLASTSPTLLAYGPLLAVDVALTATAAWACFATWAWLRRPGVVRLAGLGVAIGLLLATKYTSLLLVIAIVLVVAFAVLRGFDAVPRDAGREPRRLPLRAAGALAALTIAGAVALLVLNACYLFRAPRFDPAQAEQLASGALRAVAHLPFGARLLGLLPEPFVLGADYQAAVSRDLGGTFLDYDHPHWAYYPASLLTKTPLGVFAVLALAAFGRRRADTPALPRFTGACLAIPAVVLLGYMSVASSLQMGIRYLLPVLPLGFVFAGRAAQSRFATTRSGKLVGGLAALSCAAAVVVPWPHHIGYFNALVGGSAGGFRWFADGNCDWIQRYDAGARALEARDSGLEFLRPGDDPRFGRVAAYALDLKPPDPERPGRTYHWVTRFVVVDHDSAAWLVFDASEPAFERAIEAGDSRAARDMACAWLRERNFAAARRALDRAPQDGATNRLRAVVDAAERMAAGDAGARRQVIDGLSASGHAELALKFVGEAPRDELPELFVLMVRAGQLDGAVALLGSRLRDGKELSPIEVLLLGAGLFWQANPEAALHVLDGGPAPADDDPLRPAWQNFHEQVKQAVHAVEMLKGQPGSKSR